jgi:hypothetical protein
MELLLSVIYLNFTTEESTKHKFLNIFDTGTVQACSACSGYGSGCKAPRKAITPVRYPESGPETGHFSPFPATAGATSQTGQLDKYRSRGSMRACPKPWYANVEALE